MEFAAGAHVYREKAKPFAKQDKQTTPKENAQPGHQRNAQPARGQRVSQPGFDQRVAEMGKVAGLFLGGKQPTRPFGRARKFASWQGQIGHGWLLAISC